MGKTVSFSNKNAMQVVHGYALLKERYPNMNIVAMKAQVNGKWQGHFQLADKSFYVTH